MPKGICVSCQNEADLKLNKANGKSYCRKCSAFFDYHNKRGWKVCFSCGKLSRIALRREGQGYCQNCYRTYFAPKNPCNSCGRLMPLLSLYKGQKLCSSCRSTKRMADVTLYEMCESCRILKPVASRTIEGIAICHGCYMKGYKN